MSDATQSNADGQAYKYWAFISYSHQDNLATRGDGSRDHIQWANWLHEQLETFRIPGDYRDRRAATGEPMPERFFPAFRDEAELPTCHDLGKQIRDALRCSRFLIVIASPRSACSRYVNEEVRYFRLLGRGDRILTVIVDGEPNVRLHAKAGWTAGDDCFCPALVHPLRDDGSVDETALLPEEPIAADVRIKDIKPPREMRASNRGISSQSALLDFMKLKLIAGLMGVGLDELVQRDKCRAEEELRRVRRAASRTEFLFSRLLLDLEDYPNAYARLSKAIETDPDNRPASVFGLEEIRRVGKNYIARQRYHHKVVRGSELLDTNGKRLISILLPSAKLAVFSPDGTRILTMWGDNTAQLWDAATGQQITDPLRHERRVDSAIFSPDGRRILTIARGGYSRLWDTATGQPLMELWRDGGEINSVVFSPDGARILITDNKTVRIWNTATGQLLAEPLRHACKVRSAVFSADGARILTTSSDHSARLWETATGQPITKSLLHQAPVGFAVFSPENGRILTTSDDKTVRLWDAITGELIAVPLQHAGKIRSAVFSPDGVRVLTVSEHDTAQLWDAATGKPLAELLPHKARFNSAVFSPDGARILTAMDDNTAQLWDAITGHPLANPLQHESYVRHAVFSPDGARILTASNDKIARLWDSVSGPPLAGILRHQSGFNSAVFSPDGARILAAMGDNTAQLWDTNTGQSLAKPFWHEGRVLSAVFSPDGARILTISVRGGYEYSTLWDVTTGRHLAEPLRHENCVESAVFSPDGTRILSASRDSAQISDVLTRQPLAEPLWHEGGIRSAVFSLDGVRILTASANGTAQTWDALTGQPLAEPLRHQHGFDSAVFSPDGTRILTASSDSTARIWDSLTGLPLAEPLRHERLSSAAFSPDGVRILTTSIDYDGHEGTAQIWDAATGRPLAEPLPHVLSAVFSPDGTRILTASELGVVRVWDAPTGQLLAADRFRLRQLLEIIGGRRLNERGLLEPVSSSDIERLRRDFDTPEVGHLLRWWWSDPFTRNIHPSSQVTVPDFVRHRIREVLDWPDEQVKASALRESRDAFPHHPLVLLCLAEHGQHGDPAWLAQHAVSRLLADPHYLTPLDSCITDTDRAARAHELTLGLAYDCFLGARLLRRQNRADLAKKVIGRACKLAPKDENYRQFASQV